MQLPGGSAKRDDALGPASSWCSSCRGMLESIVSPVPTARSPIPTHQVSLLSIHSAPFHPTPFPKGSWNPRMMMKRTHMSWVTAHPKQPLPLPCPS